jgi:general secretion pathway protein B
VSFILDALRKSEGERQRDAGPAFSRVPMAVAERGIPLWIWFVMGALGVGVVVLGGLWWQSARMAAEPAPTALVGADTALPRRLEQTGIGRPESGSDALPIAARPPASPTPETAVAVPTPTPEPSQAAAPLAAPAEQAARRPAVAARARTDVRAFASVPELVASGFPMPQLVFELHVFDADASKRVVFFNGSAYREGQQIANGPRVVEITPDGVVLEGAGREVLLRRQ